MWPGAAHLQVGQLVDVGVDHGGEPAQQPGPVGRRDRPPGRPRRDGAGDGGVHLRDVERLDLGDDVLGRRIDDGVQCHVIVPDQNRSNPRRRSQSVTAASNASSSTSAARR